MYFFTFEEGSAGILEEFRSESLGIYEHLYRFQSGELILELVAYPFVYWHGFMSLTCHADEMLIYDYLCSIEYGKLVLTLGP
jgi:hypothetical protein